MRANVNAAPPQSIRSPAAAKLHLPPFPTERSVLTVLEVAQQLKISDKHVADLIDEGQIQAIDVSGNSECFWSQFSAEVARLLQAKPEVIQGLVLAVRTRVGRSATRRFWRIPYEAHQEFLRTHHSFTIAEQSLTG